MVDVAGTITKIRRQRMKMVQAVVSGSLIVSWSVNMSVGLSNVSVCPYVLVEVDLLENVLRYGMCLMEHISEALLFPIPQQNELSYWVLIILVWQLFYSLRIRENKNSCSKCVVEFLHYFQKR